MTEKKQALIVTSVGGFLPQYELENVELLKELGYCIHYASNFDNPIYSFDRDDLVRRNIKLYPLELRKSPKHLVKNARAVKTLVNIIDGKKIDLIHCHNPMGGMAARAAAVLSKRNPFVIYTAHGFHFYQGAPVFNWIAYGSAERMMARATDTLVTINHEDYLLGKRMKLRSGGTCCRVYGAGVNLNKFRPDDRAGREIRAEFNIPDNAFHIVTAAELNDNKNQKVVIEAIHKLDHSDIFYTICGEGENREVLQRMIDRFGLGDRVRLAGYRTDMERVLCSADCFAFPSIREGLGIAAVEALACGVPLIVSDNRGTREYASDDINALVADHFDVDGFADAILRLKSHPDVRSRLARNCRETAGRFDIQNTKQIMKEVYREADDHIARKTR